MDLLTQGVLGAALAQAGSKQAETRLATGIGFAAGLLADVDALIYSANDSLLTIEYHRHFTHSIFFIPLGALIAAFIMWPLLRKRISFKRLYVFSLLGYSLSGFIDACTSYGTHLFWPISDERVSFNLISIVDPLFTLPLILAVVLAYRWRRAKVAQLGLVFCGLYLLFGFMQTERVSTTIQQLAQQRGHTLSKLLVKPTFGNTFLWRSVYESDGRLYIDAVRMAWQAKVYEGESILQYNIERDNPQLDTESVLYHDMQRFSFFSDGYLVADPENPSSLIDIRYSIQPNGVEPLWGIEFDLAQPQQHAQFSVYRNLSKQNRQRFFSMLKGEELIK
ncbi:MAG: metal-dependent hydrolase [Sulfuriflexus sp.]|nr:metal-dependent hydrolase [Sulfuriflexus sp.]